MHRHIQPYIQTLNFAGCNISRAKTDHVGCRCTSVGRVLACIVYWLIFLRQVLTAFLATLSFLGIISIKYPHQAHNTGVLHKWSDSTFVRNQVQQAPLVWILMPLEEISFLVSFQLYKSRS